jgi:ribosome biogenesis SPOUT family RNA methylase Rps3
MLFVIEHLEPELSEWLRIEYSHAAEIVGRERLLITNVRRKGDFQELSGIAAVGRRRVGELFEGQELIVLDPRAKVELRPADLRGRRAIVIGGILGDEPPKGRTEKLLTRSLPGALARSIGRHQFSIDGAVYIAKEVCEGKTLRGIPVRIEVEVRLGRGHSVILPYAYPLVNGRPLVSRRLVAYLRRPWRLVQRG